MDGMTLLTAASGLTLHAQITITFSLIQNAKGVLSSLFDWMRIAAGSLHKF
jgi:hypothetical protein